MKEWATQAYVYNTGQWHKYQDTLGLIACLSTAGRMHLLNQVINRSLHEFTEDPTAQAIDPIHYEKFEKVIAEYPRSDPDENGGLAFQAICYAYLSETYKEFSVVAASVRSGSSRQKRIGDIDIYEGHSLHLTCEVKDRKSMQTTSRNNC